MIFDACMKLKCAPDEDKWAFEMSPVDFLVKSIVQFASKPSHFGQVFNVVQNDPAPARTVFDMLNEMKLISEYISVDEWKVRLHKKAEKEGDYLLNVLAQSLDDVAMYLNDESIYDCSRFEETLAKYCLQRPPTDPDYFKKFLNATLWRKTSNFL
jgi:hypothetical protein